MTPQNATRIEPTPFEGFMLLPSPPGPLEKGDFLTVDHPPFSFDDCISGLVVFDQIEEAEATAEWLKRSIEFDREELKQLGGDNHDFTDDYLALRSCHVLRLQIVPLASDEASPAREQTSSDLPEPCIGYAFWDTVHGCWWGEIYDDVEEDDRNIDLTDLDDFSNRPSVTCLICSGREEANCSCEQIREIDREALEPRWQALETVKLYLRPLAIVKE
ncbi:MAG: hypothetical protein SYC29_07230 [Planctomycetota bacterium]|nr:hypothetical protein [Planctomycetota bacterium]